MNTAAQYISVADHTEVISRKDLRIAALEQQQVQWQEKRTELEAQLAWFQRQLFGRKSEKLHNFPDPRQLSLGEVVLDSTPPPPTETVKAYQRRVLQAAPESEPSATLLRFDDSVPVQIIPVLPDEVKDLSEDDYEVVSTKFSYRLAQRPGSYVVLRYDRKVVKLKAAPDKASESASVTKPAPRLLRAPAPASVFERSLADVSFVAGMLIDKIAYYLPLYRQHQRLAASGITLSRATLTNYAHQAIDLLRPIYYAHLSNILSSKVLIMDETPVKAGRLGKGKLKQCWYWPVLGDQDEVAFPFAASRGEQFAREVLGEYAGTLVTDGYKVYAKVAQGCEQIRHAQCWVHTRRQFLKAESIEPELVRQVLELIAQLYAVEADAKTLKPPAQLAMRQEHSTEIVDAFFSFLREAMAKHSFLPSNPFTKAANYAFERERALRVFLDDARVPLDTNAVERALRPIPMGRKNWLFCWTELGAEYVGVAQSLISTCKLQGVDPYTYLVDVLQRVATHPARDVHLLTPRLWKENFAENPLRSDLVNA